MKTRSLAIFFGMSAWTHFAHAGLATFSPASQNVTPGTIVTMDLTLTTEHLPGFDTADVIINSDAPFKWKYGPDFICTSCSDNWPWQIGLGIKPYDLYVGGNTPIAFGYGNSILMGMLTFDTATLAPGTYETLVSSKLDHDISSITHFGDAERLEGRGTFTVVPEPTCALILSLGAVAAICRRRPR